MRNRIIKVLYLVLSLVLATAFWLFVDAQEGNTISEDFDDIPIEFIGAEDTLPNRGLMLVGGQDETVDIKISGPRTVVSGLSARDIRIQAYLTNINAVGTYPLTYEIKFPDYVNDSDITVERTSRNTVTVQVGTMYSRKVPVDVQVTGEVAEGYIYMAGLMVAQPSELTLRGMAEDVDQVASARVVVDLTDVNATIQRAFDYELLDDEGNVVDNSEGDIRVIDRQVEVTAPVYLVKELPLTVRVRESPGSLREYTTQCELDVETISLAGEPASLETIDEVVLGEVDLSALLSDADVAFDIPVPAGCFNLSGVTNATFSVRFRKNLEIRTFSVADIQPVGLSENQSFSKLTNSVDVQVRGPAGSMDELTAEDIRIVVDLTQYTSNGTFSVPAIVYVNGNDQVGAVGTYTVAGKLTSE